MSKECKEELVSIIIPVYNTPKQFLEECLESIRKQRYKNIEVIIVDDGSKHETASYLDTLKEKNIVIAHKNRGGSQFCTKLWSAVCKRKLHLLCGCG